MLPGMATKGEEETKERCLKPRGGYSWRKESGVRFQSHGKRSPRILALTGESTRGARGTRLYQNKSRAPAERDRVVSSEFAGNPAAPSGVERRVLGRWPITLLTAKKRILRRKARGQVQLVLSSLRTTGPRSNTAGFTDRSVLRVRDQLDYKRGIRWLETVPTLVASGTGTNEDSKYGKGKF